MQKQDIHLLFDYNIWANRRVLSTAEHVSTEQLTAPTAFPYGSLHHTLIHMLDTEYGWRMLLQHDQQTGLLTEDELPTLDHIVARWRGEEQAMRHYLAGLTDEALAGVVRYTVDEGTRKPVLWHALLHVVNHGTQHRSEAAAMLTGYGHSPGDFDFTFFLSER